MNKKNDTWQDATASAAGIRVGLQLWLFFLLSFVFLLQYSVPLSIFLGAIGGLAGGSVVTWWYSKDSAPLPSSQEVVDKSPEQVNENSLRKWLRVSQDKKKNPLLGTGWLFGEKRTLSSKSRRR